MISVKTRFPFDGGDLTVKVKKERKKERKKGKNSTSSCRNLNNINADIKLSSYSLFCFSFMRILIPVFRL